MTVSPVSELRVPRVTVSIINYRTADLTIACVESVLADIAGDDARPAIDAEVVVIDNASGDGSAEAIEAWIAARPDAPVRLIRSPVNGGFAAGHNLGFSEADAQGSDWVLVLNSDALIRPGALDQLLSAADRDSKTGLIAPALEDMDGNRQVSTFRFPTPLSEFIRGAGSGPVTHLLRRWVVALPPESRSEAIEWASFACILLRREMIESIGGLDAGYFLYFEDVEYCHRALGAGWTLITEPQSRVVHHRGGSAPVKALAAARERLPRYYYESRSRYYYQRGGFWYLWSANTLWCLGRCIAQMRRLAGKSVPKAISKESIDLWINSLSPLGIGKPSRD